MLAAGFEDGFGGDRNRSVVGDGLAVELHRALLDELAGFIFRFANLAFHQNRDEGRRARDFDGGCVEIEAIAPDDLRALCQECIEQHVDEQQLVATGVIEEAERDTLRQVLHGLSGQPEAQ